jgi:hypothetical protein
MGRRVADGRSARVTVPQSSVVAKGAFAYFSGFLGYFPNEVTTGVGESKAAVAVIEPAEYETSQILATDAFTLGQKVYWDNTNKRFTTTLTANTYAGVVTSAKDGSNVIWFWFNPNWSALP